MECWRKVLATKPPLSGLYFTVLEGATELLRKEYNTTPPQ